MARPLDSDVSAEVLDQNLNWGSPFCAEAFSVTGFSAQVKMISRAFSPESYFDEVTQAVGLGWDNAAPLALEAPIILSKSLPALGAESGYACAEDADGVVGGQDFDRIAL